MSATRSPYFFFVVRNDDDDKYRWRFYGPGNRHLADSAEGFETREACLSSISEICHQATTGLTIEYGPSAS